MSIRSRHIRWISLCVAVVLSLPMVPHHVSGAYLWISPLMLFTSLSAGKVLAWFNLMGLGALVVVVFRKRWICRFACPAGALCDMASSFGRRRGRSPALSLNLYLALAGVVLLILGIPVVILADPMNLFFMFFDGFRTGWGWVAIVKMFGLLAITATSFIFPHLWCSSVCPLGGLQELLYSTRLALSGSKTAHNSPIRSRRLFLAGAAGMMGGVLIPRLLPSRRKKVIRPPFSLGEERMNMVCARCGNCASVCPTGIIRPCLDTGEPERLFTPVVEFLDSYCISDCNACGRACPSGAIRSFSTGEKSHHVMGMAALKPDQCYLSTGKECSLCLDACDYDAILIQPAAPALRHVPGIDTSRCVGCGACQVVCPPQAILVT